MRTNRARRPTASRRPPSPRARAEPLPLDARIFGSRARRAARIQPHHRPSRPRANATVARDRESRDAFSLFFHARHRAESPSSLSTHRSIHPTTTERAILGAYRETHDRGLIDGSIAGRRDARESLALARAETNASLSSLSLGAFAGLGPRPGVAHSRARAPPAPTRARASPREAPTATDRPTRPTGCVVVDGMDTFLGHDPSFEGGHEIFSSARSSAQSCGRSVVIGES